MRREIVGLVCAIALVVSVLSGIGVQNPTPAIAATLTLRPNGPGDYTNISNQAPSSGYHWDKVDDVDPDDANSYVYTASDSQQKDAYALENVPESQTGTISSVTVYFRFRAGRQSGASRAYCQPFLRLNGVETAGTERATKDPVWTTYSETLAKPGGGSWTWQDINNLQVCIGLRHNNDDQTYYSQCTQVYVVVNYEGNSPPTDISLSPSSVAENQPVNTVVGTFTTTDPDPGDTFTYTLVSGQGSDDNASFNILGSSLRTSASFDYETKNPYSIRVRSTDQGGLWVEKQFTITVTNLNEPPVANPQSGLAVNSCQTLTVNLTASDPENDPLSYIISTLPDHGDLYDGEGTGGYLIVADDLPYTVTNENHKVTYDPNDDYGGEDSFRFKVNDGEYGSGEATVSMTVTASCTTYYKDADDDTYGLTEDSKCLCNPEGDYTATVGGDCDDTDPAIHPGATEVCNGIDDDCDNEIDEGPLCDYLDVLGDWEYYCKAGDEIWKHQRFQDFSCVDGQCVKVFDDYINDTFVQDCDDQDGWYDTGETRWVDDTPCTEKEQKEQEYRDYYCDGEEGCLYDITDTQWVDTGQTRNKPNGTPCPDDGIACTVDTCQEGVCTHTPDDSLCPEDGWYDTGETRWVADTPCTEKEQKEQEYRDYYCDGCAGCTYDVTDTLWVDTGNTRIDESCTYTITGTIRVQGKPLAGVLVRGQSNPWSGEDITDADGKYELTGVPYGETNIHITAILAGYTFDPPTITVVGPVTGPIEGLDFEAVLAMECDYHGIAPTTYAKIPFAILASSLHLIGEIVDGLSQAEILPPAVDWLPALVEPVAAWTNGPLSWTVDFLSWGLGVLGSSISALPCVLDAIGIHLDMDLAPVGDLFNLIACALFTPFNCEPEGAGWNPCGADPCAP